MDTFINKNNAFGMSANNVGSFAQTNPKVLSSNDKEYNDRQFMIARYRSAGCSLGVSTNNFAHSSSPVIGNSNDLPYLRKK